MGNLSVKVKMGIMILCAILMAAFGGLISEYNMKEQQRVSLEQLETQIRSDYDQNIKEQVEGMISLLETINAQYEAGIYTFEEAKKLAADQIREIRYGENGYFWIDQTDGTNVVLL